MRSRPLPPLAVACAAGAALFAAAAASVAAQEEPAAAPAAAATAFLASLDAGQTEDAVLNPENLEPPRLALHPQGPPQGAGPEGDDRSRSGTRRWSWCGACCLRAATNWRPG